MHQGFLFHVPIDWDSAARSNLQKNAQAAISLGVFVLTHCAQRAQFFMANNVLLARHLTQAQHIVTVARKW